MAAMSDGNWKQGGSTSGNIADIMNYDCTKFHTFMTKGTILSYIAHIYGTVKGSTSAKGVRSLRFPIGYIKSISGVIRRDIAGTLLKALSSHIWFPTWVKIVKPFSEIPHRDVTGIWLKATWNLHPSLTSVHATWQRSWNSHVVISKTACICN